MNLIDFFECSICKHTRMENYLGRYSANFENPKPDDSFFYFKCAKCVNPGSNWRTSEDLLILLEHNCARCPGKYARVTSLRTGPMTDPKTKGVLYLCCEKCQDLIELTDELAGFIPPAMDGGLGRKFR